MSFPIDVAVAAGYLNGPTAPSVSVTAPPVADMNLTRGIRHAVDDETKQIIYSLARRIASVEPIQAAIRQWADRADALYYPETYTGGGADLWPEDPSAKTPGRAHVSVNPAAVYVDVPAALQAVEPVENMRPNDTTDKARTDAQAQERLYTSWKREEEFELKYHKAMTVKGLYGLTAARIYYDQQEGRPCIQIVTQPRNMYLGWQSSDYDKLEWSAYVTRYDANALAEKFNVNVEKFTETDGTVIPFVTTGSPQNVQEPRLWQNLPNDPRVEVWDYWYREPVWTKAGNLSRMRTMNIVIAGNAIVRGPIEYREYEGSLPDEPLFNTFIPGFPFGRPDLRDIEPLIREKQEKITDGSQMIHNGAAGDFWQLTGPEAPVSPPSGLKPLRNQLVAPGPGNRIETITPFIAQFQLEQFILRLDREIAVESGMNDLLLGLAPAQVLSSSKAINALVSNYETRLSMRRKLGYTWRRKLWTKTVKVWATKDSDVATLIKKGLAYLEILDPSLSPRDEAETATRAANLVNAKLWSQDRGMDAVGVDDTATEKQLIREESTDATLWPERVELMAQLMSALQSLGLQAPQGAQDQAAGQMSKGQADLRTALGVATPSNDQGMGGPGGEPSMMGQTPALPGQPEAAGGAPAPFAQGQAPFPGQPGGSPVLQSTIQGGQVKDRIRSQRAIGRRP